MNPPNNITDFQLGGRLITRSVVESQLPAFMAALRYINDRGAVISGVSINVSKEAGNGVPDNAINPSWRDAIVDAVVGT